MFYTLRNPINPPSSTTGQDDASRVSRTNIIVPGNRVTNTCACITSNESEKGEWRRGWRRGGKWRGTRWNNTMERRGCWCGRRGENGARNASSLARAPYEILIKFHNLETTFALSHRIVPPRDLSFCRRNGTRVVVSPPCSSSSSSSPLLFSLPWNMLMLHSPLPVPNRPMNVLAWYV